MNLLCTFNVFIFNSISLFEIEINLISWIPVKLNKNAIINWIVLNNGKKIIRFTFLNVNFFSISCSLPLQYYWHDCIYLYFLLIHWSRFLLDSLDIRWYNRLSVFPVGGLAIRWIFLYKTYRVIVTKQSDKHMYIHRVVEWV